MNSERTTLSVLREVFGYESFIGLQQGVINQLMSGGDAVALMPTGGGKSLCYQIPSIMRPGVGVVVSPLIALMRDQVAALTQAGVRAAYLNSSLSSQEAFLVERQVEEGALDLVYVAPERLLTDRFLALLDRVQAGPRVALIAIDEAHCVSQWGHDFRPEYTQLSVLAERYPGVPRIACTATADKATREDIRRHLMLEEAAVFAAGFDRPNIRYTVTIKDKPLEQLLRFIQENHAGQTGIVYRMTRKDADATASWLSKHGVPALAYHAGLESAERDARQERFMRESGLVMCATVAFGMGVDKPDVRFVAHLDLPKSLEAYHQETGRAGRDGLAANAWMAYGMNDIVRLRRIIFPSNEDRENESEQDMRQRRIEWLKLNAVLGFCEAAGCRRQGLLGYFGEELAEPCGNCDGCLAPAETWDGTVAAQKALSCVFRTGARFGAAHLADVLTGTRTRAVEKWGHDRVSTWNIGDELDRKGWMSVYRQLAAAGYLLTDIEGYGGLKLTDKSWQVLKDGETVRLKRDAAAAAARKAMRRKPPKGEDAEKLLEGEEPRALWETLRKHRLSIAEEQRVPPYTVFTDRSLLEMVRYRPRTLGELGQLHGVGVVKLERYGEEFLGVLAEHERHYGRPEDTPELDPVPEPTLGGGAKAEPDTLSPTEEQSVLLLRQLGSAEAVAAERGVKPGTVYRHLARAVALGKADPGDVLGLSDAAAACVAETIRQHRDAGFTSLTPVYDALNGEVGFEALRCIRAGLDRIPPP